MNGLRGLKQTAALADEPADTGHDGSVDPAKLESAPAAATPASPPAAAAPRTAPPAPRMPPRTSLASVGAKPASEMGGDLEGFAAPADAPTPAAAPTSAVDATAPSALDLQEAVRKASAESGASRAPEHVAPSPESEVEPTVDPGVTQALTGGVDGVEGFPNAEGEKKDDEKEPDPDEELRRQAMADRIIALLSSTGEPDEVTRGIANDYLGFLRDNAAKEKELGERQGAIDLDKKRRAGLEAGRQAVGGRGGRGGIGAGIGNMVGAMLNMGRNRFGAERKLSDDIEANAFSYNRSAEGFRDRIYSHRIAQFTENLLAVESEGNVLKDAVADYNQSFLTAPAAKPLTDAFEAWMERDGIDADRAVRVLGEGKAPPDVAQALQSVRDEVFADPEVAARRARMLQAEENYSQRAQKVANDAEIIGMNFPDSKFDPEIVRDSLTKRMDEIARDIPDPIAEDENRQKMKERMKDVMDAIRRSFDKLIEAISRLLSRRPSAA